MPTHMRGTSSSYPVPSPLPSTPIHTSQSATSAPSRSPSPRPTPGPADIIPHPFDCMVRRRPRRTRATRHYTASPSPNSTQATVGTTRQASCRAIVTADTRAVRLQRCKLRASSSGASDAGHGAYAMSVRFIQSWRRVHSSSFAWSASSSLSILSAAATALDSASARLNSLARLLAMTASR